MVGEKILFAVLILIQFEYVTIMFVCVAMFRNVRVLINSEISLNEKIMTSD